jgi:two-component system cell cycle response regulator
MIEPRSASLGAVLLVDDDSEYRSLVSEALSGAHLSCIEVSSGEACLEIVMASPRTIDTIILDVAMDGLSGLDVLGRLKSEPDTVDIPVILMTGSARQDEDVVTGVRLGASDYICKPCTAGVLVAKVQAWCARAQSDRQLREKLEIASKDAMTDPLTGLMNRRSFDVRIVEASAHAQRHAQPFAIVIVDIDRFKNVNDTHGHVVGDQVLVEFAHTIQSVLRAEDTAFRFGGEEFVMLLQSCDATCAIGVADRLRNALRSRPFRFDDGATQEIAFSAGVAAAGEGLSSEGLVRRADEALYRAKTNGRDRTER